MISSSDLGELIQSLLLERPQVDDAPFSEIVIDSREAVPGSLFVALRGERMDGH
ncbi:MAG: UDP-N-acetylmuramoyl-tripeptide--D-alanyl-D-alanine ligase, partial [Chloroflexi bacterium]|nr:UDP-N-acetylmuramoyl-tripeptide--D-alanyl-D-alanine ligase [Chloroflexota bacterium]